MDEPRRARREVDLNAILRRQEEANTALRDLMMTVMDGVDDRLGRLERAEARNEQRHVQHANEFGEIRTLIATARQDVQNIAEALKMDRATRLATSFSLAGWIANLAKWQKGAVFGGVLFALAWTADKGPGMVRFLNHAGHAVAEFWRGMGR